jgi:hypothetical protein
MIDDDIYIDEHACARTVAFLLLSSLEQSEPTCGISLFEL